MKRLLPRLLLALAVPALAAAGYLGWRSYAARQAWDEMRPALPATVGAIAPGLDARLARCMERMKKWPPDAAALSEFTRTCHANGLFDPAIAGYQALIKLQPAEPRWPYLLASIIAGYGRLEEAVPLLRRTTALAPDYNVAQLKLGDALLKSNATAEAETAYGEALLRDPDNRYALLGLARCDLQAERLTAARAHLQQAVANHPDFASAQSLLGTVFERLGNSEAAAIARERVQSGGHYVEPADPWADELVLDSHDPYTLLIAASAAVADGYDRKARQLLDRGLELAPSDARLHRQLAKTLTLQGDLPNARSHMERAVALDPTNDAIRMDLLAVLRRVHDDAAIEKVVADGLAASPHSAGIHFEAGLLDAQAGRLDEAAKHFKFTWQTSPDQTAAAFELANVYFRSGHEEAGVAVLEESFARHPQESAALLKLIRHGIETRDQRTAAWLQRAIKANAPTALIAELQQDYQRRFGAASP